MQTLTCRHGPCEVTSSSCGTTSHLQVRQQESTGHRHTHTDIHKCITQCTNKDAMKHTDIHGVNEQTYTLCGCHRLIHTNTQTTHTHNNINPQRDRQTHKNISSQTHFHATKTPADSCYHSECLAPPRETAPTIPAAAASCPLGLWCCAAIKQHCPHHWLLDFCPLGSLVNAL